jgi:molybdopterin synthase catalytic subunit
VALSAEPLDPSRLEALVSSPGGGGCAVFIGTVRAENRGREVTRLRYEAYEAMAVKEIERILDEARSRFGVLDLAAHHRVGDLDPGEVAVVVVVSSVHRAEALAALSHVIDELKARAPIWKKEFYRDGETWLGHCP